MMSFIPCHKCAGEGRIFKSKYGGNDPDVWDAGQCEACEGSGHQECEARGCTDLAAGFNDDGEALCLDCITEWAMKEFEP
jgi:hypothetical protein